MLCWLILYWFEAIYPDDWRHTRGTNCRKCADDEEVQQQMRAPLTHTHVWNYCYISYYLFILAYIDMIHNWIQCIIKVCVCVCGVCRRTNKFYWIDSKIGNICVDMKKKQLKQTTVAAATVIMSPAAVRYVLYDAFNARWHTENDTKCVW